MKKFSQFSMKVKNILPFLIILLSAIYLNANDSARVIKLNNQAMHLMLSDPGLAASKLDKAISVSQKTGYIKGLLISHKNLGNLFFHEKRYRESLLHYKKALSYAESTHNVQEIAGISLSMGKVFNLIGDKESALFYLDKARKYFSFVANIAGLHETYQTLSMVHQAHNEYFQALYFGFEALKISKNFDNKEKLVLSLGNLGQIYTLLNQKHKALEHYLQAVQYAETGPLSAYLPILYIKTGTLYRETNNFQKSVSFLLKAYELFSKFGNKDGMIAALTETGITYKLFRQNSKALNYFLRAKAIAEKEGNYPRIISLNKEISDLYILQKNMHKAIVYLDMNFNIAKELQDAKLEAEALMNTGFYYMQAGNYPRAADLLQQSYVIASQINNSQLLAQITDNLSITYAKAGQFEKAYKYSRLNRKFSHQLNLSVENTTFTMLQSVFEVTNTQRELELLRKTNEIERLEKQKAVALQKRLLYGIFFLIVLMAIMVYLISKFRKTNRILKIKSFEIEASNKALLDMNISLEKQKHELHELNKSLSEANRMLKESEERYRSISTTKDKLFSVISHDLRSPFASVVSFVRMMKRDMHSMTKKEIAELTLELEDTTERINVLLENLLQWSKVQRGRISFTPVALNLFEITNETCELLSSVLGKKGVKLALRLDTELYVYADKLMITTVIRNLLSNALKFSSSGDEISITSEIQNGDVIYSISDMGKGLTQEQLDAHLSGIQPFVRQGTNEEKGSGLGLLICQEFLHFHGSSVQVRQNNGKGSVFYFVLKQSDYNG